MCEECKDKLQAKLAVGPVDDPLEHEADRIADGAMASSPLGGAGDTPVRLQRAGGTDTASMQSAPPSVERTLASDGRPLEPMVRHDMEQRFGHDFFDVRVHDDAQAQTSAQDVKAHAYTVGQHIVFGPGKYQPRTHEGQRLLAHELAHVVQQDATPVMVRREPQAQTKPTSKIDVAIVLSDDEQDMIEGRAYAKTVLRVTDIADAAEKLKALGVPVGRLYVVSHSSAAGHIEFVSSIGTISWVPIGDLAKKLKGKVSIDDVDFRGCKMGSAEGAMESFRRTIGAHSARGSNCWTFIQRVTPLTIDGVPVTSPSQIPKRRQAAFDKALLAQLLGMKAGNGKPVRNCLLGLPKHEQANAKNLAKVWSLYWANGGNLVAGWASPEFNRDWQEGSICIKDLAADTKPCAIVETKAPASAPTQGGKTGALEGQLPGVEVGLAGQGQEEETT